MKIERLHDSRYYQFSFRERNIFHVETLNDFYTINKVHDLILSTKLENNDFKIKFEDHDSSLSNDKIRVIKVANFFDFDKDIQMGSKSILKEMISIILDLNINDFDEVVEVKNLYDNLDLKLSVLNNFVSKLEGRIDNKVSIKTSGDILDFICSNIKFDIDDFSYKYDQEKNFIIYLTILEYIYQLSDNKIYIIFTNPFSGLSGKEIEKMNDILDKINTYSIISFSIAQNFFKNHLDEIKYITKSYIIDSSYILNDIDSFRLFETANIEIEVKELLSLISISLNSNVINALEYSLAGNQKDLFLSLTNKFI